MTFKTFSVSVMAKCGFSKFVGDSCGHGTSSADTQCITLGECKKDIKPHLRGFKAINSTLMSEKQLIFVRADIVPNYAFHQIYLYLMLT